MTHGSGVATTRTSRRLWLPVAIAIAVVALIAALVAGRQPADDGVTDAESTPQTTGEEDAAPPPDEADDPQVPELARRIDGDVTAMGAVDAPVVMVEFADYRCPFCAVFATETMPTLVEEYVDSGQLRYEWRDMPIFGEESVDAAVAGRAAGNQGKFWEFHAAVFGAAPDRGHPDLSPEDLIGFAEEIGVPDIDAFEQDLSDPELMDAVRADATEGQAVGVSSVPVFLVGETPVAGAQPLAVFQETIDAELAKVG